MSITTLSELVEAGSHFGHQVRRWNPKMLPYIYEERNGVHIIDLVRTSQLLMNACNYVRKVSTEGKQFLFVGTRRHVANIVAQEAERCGAYYINQHWLGGTLTNWSTIKMRVERLRELECFLKSGHFDQLPKKEVALLYSELEKLRKNLGGIHGMQRLPDVVVIVDQKHEYTAVQECIKLGIPTVSILDTNCNPDLTDLPIPANDDAVRSVKLILGKLSEAIYDGFRETSTHHKQVL
uniref:Small ribosomal subunit protein uS2c n=1 Tax=Cryptomonas sp. CCAC 1634B TaxID=2051848 RepID=A0A679CAB6_9CRYP|nr:ribosomal protein S2 [Cryptomonas sp. CCAC 1634B]